MSHFPGKLALIAGLSLLPLAAMALEPMSDASLAGVTGRSGIAVGFELRLNTNASGAAVGSGCGQANPDFSDGVAEGCRLGINLNNRPGEWLVLKDLYGSLELVKVHLDAACTSGTPQGDGSCSGGGNSPDMSDPGRFENESGTCLLTGDTGGCLASDANNLPVLQFSTPGGPATFEDDILWHLHLGGMAVEYGVSGYDNDNNGSFLGAVLTDTQQNQARIDVDGTLKMFGF